MDWPLPRRRRKMKRVTISTVQHSSEMHSCGEAAIIYYLYSNTVVTANLLTHDRLEAIIRHAFFRGRSVTASNRCACQMLCEISSTFGSASQSVLAHRTRVEAHQVGTWQKQLAETHANVFFSYYYYDLLWLLLLLQAEQEALLPHWCCPSLLRQYRLRRVHLTSPGAIGNKFLSTSTGSAVISTNTAALYLTAASTSRPTSCKQYTFLPFPEAFKHFWQSRL